MGFFPPLYDTIVNFLIWVAVAAHLLSASNNEARLKIGVIVIGFFALLYLFPDDFFLVQTLIVAWLFLTGAEMIVSRQVMFALLGISVALSYFLPGFFFINFLFYFIVLGGFVLSAFRKIVERVKTIS